MMARIFVAVLFAAGLSAAEPAPPVPAPAAETHPTASPAAQPAQNQVAEDLNLLSKVLGECDALSQDLESASSQRNFSVLFAFVLTAACLWLLLKKKPEEKSEPIGGMVGVGGAVKSGPIANITIRDGATQAVQSSGVVQTRRVVKRNTQAYERTTERTDKHSPPPEPPAAS